MAATAYVSVRAVSGLLAVICACAMLSSFPVDGSPSTGDDFSPAAQRARYSARLQQLQLTPAARRRLIGLLPVIDRKPNVDDKRDDSAVSLDVDYGWGGGRFGKRRSGGDSLSLGGRPGHRGSVYDFDGVEESK